MTGSDQFLVEVSAIWQNHISQYSAIAVTAMRFDHDIFTKYHLEYKLFGPIAERLALF
jgi:hypothetical protein